MAPGTEEGRTRGAEAVWAVVCAIPEGTVATYGQVAKLAGMGRGARAVGRILHGNPDPVHTPCHRVVFADGSVAPSYAFGGAAVQRDLLEHEGVPFKDDGRVDLDRARWVPRGDGPIPR